MVTVNILRLAGALSACRWNTKWETYKSNDPKTEIINAYLLPCMSPKRLHQPVESPLNRQVTIIDATLMDKIPDDSGGPEQSSLENAVDVNPSS